MSRYRIDTSISFSPEAYADLPETRLIEQAEVDIVKPDEPPMEEVQKEVYEPDRGLVEAVNLAIALGRPLLLQGEPGCGKTRLAYAVAYALGLPLETCYIKSTTRASDLLYLYDAVSRLYEAQLGKEKAGRVDNIRNYIKMGPLGRAIVRAQYGRRSVVLIDEIDKADLDFPNDLLYELDRMAFQVAEAPEIRYNAFERRDCWPVIIVTHNEEKALPSAFLRRCIFHYIKCPETSAQLEKILGAHKLNHSPVTKKAIDLLLRLRKMDLNKKPGLSEMLDWVGYLEAVTLPTDQLDQLPYLGVLLKQQADINRAREEFLSA